MFESFMEESKFNEELYLQLDHKLEQRKLVALALPAITLLIFEEEASQHSADLFIELILPLIQDLI